MGDEQQAGSRGVTLRIRGELRAFDIDDPVLPDWVEKEALSSGGHPYDKKLKREVYEEELKTPDRTG